MNELKTYLKPLTNKNAQLVTLSRIAEKPQKKSHYTAEV